MQAAVHGHYPTTLGLRIPTSESAFMMYIHMHSYHTYRLCSDNGRFSNGRVWVEYVAGNLSIPLVDYAIGGGKSVAAPYPAFPPKH